MNDFTTTQRAAIQPFLPALLKRYREVAATGESDRPDPLCAKVPVGHCYECPVFGKEEGEWYHCTEGYFPLAPPCVDDTRLTVTCGKNPDAMVSRFPGRKTSREQAKEWGAAMVLRLEELREQAPAQK